MTAKRVFPDCHDSWVVINFMNTLSELGYTVSEIQESCTKQFADIYFNWDEKTDVLVGVSLDHLIGMAYATFGEKTDD